MEFFKTYTIRLGAISAAAITAVVFGALGFYQKAGAYVIGWLPYATPEMARWLFWVSASALLILFVIIPTVNRLRRRDYWAEREELELSAIANLSVGKGIDEKYDDEPQLSRHRLLKDAVRKGQLQIIDMMGEKPNVHTLVSRRQLREYAKESNNSDLLALVNKWDRINPHRESSKQVTAPQTESPISPDGIFSATPYLPSTAPAILLSDGWILNFNPEIFTGRKLISFNSDGKIGEGRNSNEYTWSMVGDELEIRRQNGDLQNRFRFDRQGNKFISTNHPDAKGIKDQFIFRDRAVQKST